MHTIAQGEVYEYYWMVTDRCFRVLTRVLATAYESSYEPSELGWVLTNTYGRL